MKDYEEKKEYLYHQQSGRCASCKRHLVSSDKLELAHIVRASKFNYGKWGEQIIDHVLNLALTHSGRCNDFQNRSRAAHPIESATLIEDIKNSIMSNK